MMTTKERESLAKRMNWLFSIASTDYFTDGDVIDIFITFMLDDIYSELTDGGKPEWEPLEF